MYLMTDEEYVAAKGTKCPSCRSTNLVGNPVEIDGGTATQNMICGDCFTTWTDLYRLVGVMELIIGEPVR